MMQELEKLVDGIIEATKQLLQDNINIRIPRMNILTISDMSSLLPMLDKIYTCLEKFEQLLLLTYAYLISYDKLKKFSKKLEEPDIKEAMQNNVAAGRKGSVRVAKLSGARIKNSPAYAKVTGFVSIDITYNNCKSLGSQLSPHKLRCKTGEIMENLWQFCRFYDIVPEVSSDSWTWHLAQHCDSDNKPTKAYWEWRKAGFTHNQPAIPVKNKKPICYLWKEGNSYKQHNAVSARKNIYAPLYKKLAELESDFIIIKHLVNSGYNIQLLDYIGPPITTSAISEYEYKNICKLYEDLGEQQYGTIEINEKNFSYIIGNESIPLSHCYVLGYMLVC